VCVNYVATDYISVTEVSRNYFVLQLCVSVCACGCINYIPIGSGSGTVIQRKNELVPGLCVCICVCARACVCVCVYVCVSEFVRQLRCNRFWFWHGRRKKK